MKLRESKQMLVAVGLMVVIGAVAVAGGWNQDDAPPQEKKTPEKKSPENKSAVKPSKQLVTNTELPPGRAPLPFVEKGIVWLVRAQHSNGGWGGGSHANQQNRDPLQVKVDPATTAFVACTLLRAGHTPAAGKYKDAVRRATEYLCTVVEEYNKEGPKITDITGTQPQSKLGPLVDTTLTSQFLAQVSSKIEPSDPLKKRVDAALRKCVSKLEKSQKKDGSWNVAGGWAPVLQSSLGCSALEWAQAVGCPVSSVTLDRARSYQKGNFDQKTGAVKAGDAAGVALYAFSGAQRANAGEARAAQDLVQRGKNEGKLDKSAKINADNLQKLGIEKQQAERLATANDAIVAQNARVDDESLLRGFGSNGGEEYLSYLMTAESLLITDTQKWKDWDKKMGERLNKIQSADGSWSGHHCITSPVFCTAAVVQCMTADRDGQRLLQIARNAAKRRDKAEKTVAKDEQ